jgi:hypothetical protein
MLPSTYLVDSCGEVVEEVSQCPCGCSEPPMNAPAIRATISAPTTAFRTPRWIPAGTAAIPCPAGDPAHFSCRGSACIVGYQVGVQVSGLSGTVVFENNQSDVLNVSSWHQTPPSATGSRPPPHAWELMTRPRKPTPLSRTREPRSPSRPMNRNPSSPTKNPGGLHIPKRQGLLRRLWAMLIARI